MREINLLEKSHPQIKRDIPDGWRTEKNKEIAMRFDRDFFDGDRANGYGGYYYDGRWKKTVEKMIELYSISPKSSVLDIGCAKGFLLHDLESMLPGIRVAGIDISEYAVSHAMEGYSQYLLANKILRDKSAPESDEEARTGILPRIILGSADNLPWAPGTFDVVLSINTAHNLPEDRCKKAITEMLRVGKDKRNMFIQVDGYKTDEERIRLDKWILTGKTILPADQWVNLFEECGYDGDYFWTTV